MDPKLFISKWRKRNGKLEFKNPKDATIFQTMIDGLRDGQVVEFVVDFERDDGRLSQIAKLKSGIRTLSRESGVTFKVMEDRVKTDAGLHKIQNDQEVKSFADCSKQELSDAIQVMIEFGDFLNIDLK